MHENVNKYKSGAKLEASKRRKRRRKRKTERSQKKILRIPFNNNNRQITIHVEVELMPGLCIIVEFACRQARFEADE